MQVETEPEDIHTKKADSRGRICLGPEYANEEVSVAVLKSIPVPKDTANSEEADGV